MTTWYREQLSNTILIDKLDALGPNLLLTFILDRLIYSNIAGYLSGHSLSIMSAKICIENPEATSLSFVIKQFFNVYKAWLFDIF